MLAAGPSADGATAAAAILSSSDLFKIFMPSPSSKRVVPSSGLNGMFAAHVREVATAPKAERTRRIDRHNRMRRAVEPILGIEGDRKSSHGRRSGNVGNGAPGRWEESATGPPADDPTNGQFPPQRPGIDRRRDTIR
jgi:hypothetical protein